MTVLLVVPLLLKPGLHQARSFSREFCFKMLKFSIARDHPGLFEGKIRRAG
jgi:hypothetical protein